MGDYMDEMLILTFSYREGIPKGMELSMEKR